MKLAQEIRAGNVIMQGKDPMVVLKTEYSRGGRGAATVRMKMKNLLNGGGAVRAVHAERRVAAGNTCASLAEELGPAGGGEGEAEAEARFAL